MGEVGKLSKLRFYEEDTFGGGMGVAATASDHAVDSIGGPGPDRDMIEHDKIAGAYGTRYAFPGKLNFARTYTLEMNDDNDTWLNTACVERTSNVQQSYVIYEYDAGGQNWQANGCKCDSINISWQDGAEVIVSMDWLGNGEIAGLGTADAISTFTPESFMTNTPYTIPSFSIGGVTTYDVIGYNAQIDNNLVVGPINATYYAKSLSEGAQLYSVEFTMHNPNSTALLAKCRGGTLVTATVTNSDGSNTQTMTFSNCLIAGPAPSSIDPESITEITVRLTPTSATQFTWSTG